MIMTGSTDFVCLCMCMRMPNYLYKSIIFFITIILLDLDENKESVQLKRKSEIHWKLFAIKFYKDGKNEYRE